MLRNPEIRVTPMISNKEMKMASKPSTDLKLHVKTLVEGFVFLGLLILATSGFAASPTSHFEIGLPDKAVVGEEVEIKISAVDKDGVVIPDAHHEVDVVFSAPEETINKELDIVNGVGILNIKFEKVTFYLVNVADKLDPQLTRCGSIRIIKSKAARP